MFLKATKIVLVGVVGVWSRDVSGIETKRRGSAMVGGRKVRDTLGLALRERTKAKASYCPLGGKELCPEWTKEGDHYRVPYEFRGYQFTPKELEAFNWVVKFFEKFANVKFVRRGADETGKFIDIFNDGRGSCSSDGFHWNDDVIEIKLSSSCMTTGKISEYLMQASGFYYEHTRPDRDDYLIVQNICNWANVLFQKIAKVAFSTPYDFASVMQLPSRDSSTTCSEENPKNSDVDSLVAKDSAYKAVMDADRMAPSSCDLAALYKRFEGPAGGGGVKCVAHELPPVCEPLPACEETLSKDACREQCQRKCQHHIAPTSEKPTCRLLDVDEISFEARAEDSDLEATPPPPSTSSTPRPGHSPGAVLLSCAAAVASTLFLH